MKVSQRNYEGDIQEDESQKLYFWWQRYFNLHTIEFCILGTLAPSLKPSKLNDTIDLIFATHWIYPSQTPVLQADDEKCVNDELSKRSGTLT